MMKLIHYSKDVNFSLEEKQPGGADKPGAFFYPEGNECEWGDRTRQEFYVDDNVAEKIVETVQEFEAGYFDINPDHDIIEVFVAAENFKYLEQL